MDKLKKAVAQHWPNEAQKYPAIVIPGEVRICLMLALVESAGFDR